ncbi:putative disease resistance RPP13-like protein 1 [Salvia miltiorrhiza]|uniref:putative disease resistance RPP13-like protein 1 n=1 Tax=Salvia miltiorrhiza TaxID=226208 RepID=UPI0025AC09A1|nr:putative disease resistance RPP13-like protein 1 [Salvia miltiorrhiza]
MEGEAAAAVLQTLVQNLIDLSKKEISQIRGLRKDAEKLTKSLKTIQKFLNDAETRDITSGAVKDWLKKLEDVAFDADNVLDEVNYHILSKQIKATKPMKAKVLSPFSSSFNSIARPRKMAVRIQEINEKLASINEEATALGLREKLDNEPALVIAALETDSYTLDPIFIGRDDVESEIVEMITSSITTEQAVFILPIVGMGGLGKTTLTRKVFNHVKMEGRFGSRIWVDVSLDFDPIILFKKILKELTYFDQVESKQDILSKLKEALKDKTYLLVLDDVWNQDSLKWEDFMNSLLGVSCDKGNAIVITTRIMEVASIMNTIHIHELKGLLEEECWSIIREKAFGKKDVPSQFEAIGRKIARRCQGLPLAANIVGGVLHDKSEDKWRSIEEKWLSPNEGGDNITEILRLSFDNLSPPFLKKCFAYCAMFPKGSEIIKQELIEMWMAEGFLQADGRDDMESMGELFINILLHNSLLQVLWGDYYGMHDLVHDFACFVSGGSSRVRYMTLGDNYCGEESSGIPKEMAKSLRTLLITSEADISDINFSDLESLHVLRLDSEVKELPSSIQKLIHLRDFDISNTRIEVLPDWIGEFFHLQTLRVDSSDFRIRRKLPSTIKYLINLRHLYIDWRVELPMGIGRLTSLQTLTHFPVGDENGCKIEELGSLINLKGEVQIQNLERVHDKEEAGKADLIKKSKILNLCLNWNTYGTREGETNDEDVLEGLQPHSDLRELEIWGFNGRRFPLWTQKMSVRDAPQGSWVLLNNLMSLSLSYCGECEEIPMLGHLPNLKSLWLDGLFNLKCINSSFYGMVNKDTRIVFPALERFELSFMDKLAEWAEIEISDESEVKLFPRLKYLKIEYCYRLKSVPSLGQLPNLMTLELAALYNLKCINSSFYGMVNKDTHIVFPALEKFKLHHMPKLAEWAEIEISDVSEVKLFPRLQHLQIIDCPQLMSVPSHVSSCLKSMAIDKIGVECLPADWIFSNNQTLSYLVIRECPNLREISDRWGEEESQGRSFTITSLPKFPRLTHLTIVGVPKLSLETVDAMRRLQIHGNKHINPDGVPKLRLSSLETTARLTIDECDQWSSSTEVELQKENVAATPVENQGSEPPSTSDSTPVPDAVVPKTFPVDSSSSSLSIEIKDSEAKISVKHQREIQEVDEPTSSSNAKRSMHHQESIASPIYFQEEGHYLVVLKDKHLRLELINNQSFLIGDSPSAVKPMLSLVEKDLHELPEKPNYPNSLILLLQRNKRLSLIHRSFFDTMPDLSFLDMSDTKIRNLPSSLFELSKLKVLLLRNCICLEELPHEIGKLRRMEALDLSGTELYELPDEISELTLMRSLQLSFYGPDDESEYDDLPSRLVSPSFLSELKGIEALSVSVHPEDQRWTKTVADMIKDVSRLERLSYLHFYFPQVETFESFIQTSPAWKKQSLRKFELTVGQNVKRIASRVPDEVESLFSREERCLRYVNGDKVLPLIKSALTHVTSFYLDHHTETRSLSEFDNSNFDGLKFCLVRECPKMQAILDEENAGSAFPCLEYLGIYFLWELKQVWKPAPQAGRVKRIFKTPTPLRSFEALRFLIISTCPKLCFILRESMLQCFAKLEELIVEDCERVEEIIKKENEKVKYENNALPSLRKLELRYLPELVGLGCGIRLSKEEISVYGCPKLIPNS